jgi:hypothetical protein
MCNIKYHMSKKFCPKCNYGTPQADVIIKFCSNCGYNFVSASMPIANICSNPPPIRVQKKTVARQLPEPETEDEDVIYEDTDSSNIQFGPPEIEFSYPKRQSEKISVLATSRSPKEQFDRPKMKKMNKKQIAEDFANELRSKRESKESSEIVVRGDSGD